MILPNPAGLNSALNLPMPAAVAHPSADPADLRARGMEPVVVRRRLGIVYNAQSGRYKRLVAGHPLPVGVSAISACTFDEIGAAAARLVAEGVDLLVVAGGDGTVRAALSHLLLRNSIARLPLIAIVPSGSTNMTAADAGWVDIRGRGWAPLIEWLTEPANTSAGIRERAILKIQANPSTAAFCGLFFGAGAVHYAVQYTQSRLHRAGLRGSLGSAFTFARFAKAIATGNRRHFAPTTLRAADDRGHEVDQETLFLAASTLRRLVLGFQPFWGDGDGALRWSAVADDATGLFRRLPGVAWGRPGGGRRPANGYHSYSADSLELWFDGGFVVDGECYVAERAAGPVTLSIAGRARFLAL